MFSFVKYYRTIALQIEAVMFTIIFIKITFLANTGADLEHLVKNMSRLFLGLTYILSFVVYIGAFLIHLWTVVIAFSSSGLFGAAITFFFPFLSQIYWAYRAISETGFESPFVQWLIVLVTLWVTQYLLSLIAAYLEVREDRIAERMSAAALENSGDVIEINSNNGKYYYGFGGWLILFAIGLIISFCQSLFYLFGTFFPWVQSPDFKEALAINPRLGIIVLGEFLFHLGAIVLISLIGYFCLKQRRAFPKTAVGFMIFLFVANIILYLLYLMEPLTAEFSGDTLGQIFRAMIYCAIWIPYMLKSRRVRNTYIR